MIFLHYSLLQFNMYRANLLYVRNSDNLLSFLYINFDILHDYIHNCQLILVRKQRA